MADRVRFCLWLTPEGKEAVAEAHLGRQNFYPGVLEGWEPRDQRELALLLAKFVRSLDATGSR